MATKLGRWRECLRVAFGDGEGKYQLIRKDKDRQIKLQNWVKTNLKMIIQEVAKFKVGVPTC